MVRSSQSADALNVNNNDKGDCLLKWVTRKHLVGYNNKYMKNNLIKTHLIPYGYATIYVEVVKGERLWITQS